MSLMKMDILFFIVWAKMENPVLDEPIIRKSIEWGADINLYRYGFEDWWDLTPIVIAASHGNIEVITFLLQYGPEVQDTRALALSVRNGNLHCIVRVRVIHSS